MNRIWKRIFAAGLAVSVFSCGYTPEMGKIARAEESVYTMESSGTDGTEDWEKLTIDLGGPETDNEYGYGGTPLGNGLFAAKENGGVTEDVFILNHSTFWSGDPAFREAYSEGEGGYQNTQEERNAAYRKLVDTLKSAYKEGISQDERDTLMRSIQGTTSGMWEANASSAFLGAGRMKLSFPELNDTTDYQRILNLDTAASEIYFSRGQNRYSRETFISNPDNVMVTRISNEKKEPMDMELSLELHSNMVGKSSDNQVMVDKETMEIIMDGRAPYDFEGTKWSDDRGTLIESRAKIILPGDGKISAKGSTLKVENASEIIVLYTSETSFKDAFTDPSNSGVDYKGKAKKTMNQASEMSYEELKGRHLEEYRSLFRRFWLDMEGEDIQTENGTMVSPYEYARNYQYGRYVNICCERENSIMPQGLLGMWCPEWSGPNQGAYFLNENMEKMQILKGAGNLSDTSDSQYRYISSWAEEETGQKTAQKTYGAEEGAWMMSHSTGIWAKSGMWGENIEWGSWLAGGIWALDSLFDKYEYTQDLGRLEEVYPLLEGAAKFALSTLIEVDGVEGELRGYKVVAPAGSPEHWYWVGDSKAAFDVASACDTLLYYNLFNMMEQGAKSLEKAGISYDKGLLKRVMDARKQMIPLEMFIDKDTGRLKEWYNEYPVGDTGHRHASHLLGLFLGHININENDTPELYAAQKKEAERWMYANGGTHPDRSLMVMRAGFEDYAFSHMSCGIIGTGYNHDEVMKWTAITASVGEAIVDSRFGQINLMDNLPTAWGSGTVKGIRAKGGYQLSITWKDGELESCVIDSPTGETPRVMYKGEPVVLSKDGRFKVNRAESTWNKLKDETEEKLDGKYTSFSKAALQAAVQSGEYGTIRSALMAMEPVKTMVTDITLESEGGVNVLTEKGQMLSLKASCEKREASYRWEIKNEQGGNASKIASVDTEGRVTAVGGGRVTVTASLENEPNSKASIELLVELPAMKKESIDDRSSRISYEGDWSTWEEEKHVNGTITYSNTEASRATLEFEGTGIEYVGSSAAHISDFKVIIDGKTAKERVEVGESGYGKVLYSDFGLSDGIHRITICPLGNRVDIDAFYVHVPVPAKTDRKELIAGYRDLKKLSEEEGHTQEFKTALQDALNRAVTAINDLGAEQNQIEAAEKALLEAKGRLEKIRQEEEKKKQEEEKRKQNQQAANVVKALISQIGKVSYTTDSKAKLEAAKNTYAALTEAQKLLVDNVDVLTAADKEYRRMESAVKRTKVKKVSLKSVKSIKKKQLKTYWKKISGVSGYEVQYSTDRKFRKAKIKKAGRAAASVLVKGLKRGKVYRVRVRAYKIVYGKKVCGAYSRVRKVKVR